MNESILERIQSSAKALKIELYTAELASYADEKELTPDKIACEEENLILYFGNVRYSGIQKGSMTERSDFFDFLFILSHYGTSAGCKQ